MTTTPVDVERLMALCDQATPGPWEWYGNTKQHEVYLATTHSGRRFVMDFVRWGMGGAQPRFQVTIDGGEAGGGVMRSLSELASGDVNAKGRLPILGPKFEVDYRRQFVGIGHPDAAFIAAARSAVPALIDENTRLHLELQEARGERDEARQAWDSGVAEMTKASYAQVSLVTNRLHDTEAERDAARAECERLKVDASRIWSETQWRKEAADIERQTAERIAAHILTRREEERVDVIRDAFVGLAADIRAHAWKDKR
jgi:hypothetical protein